MCVPTNSESYHNNCKNNLNFYFLPYPVEVYNVFSGQFVYKLNILNSHPGVTDHRWWRAAA